MRGRIKVASFALVGVAGVVGAVCYHTQLLNNPWSSSFRVIRFGRATNAVRSSFSIDYTHYAQL